MENVLGKTAGEWANSMSEIVDDRKQRGKATSKSERQEAVTSTELPEDGELFFTKDSPISPWGEGGVVHLPIWRHEASTPDPETFITSVISTIITLIFRLPNHLSKCQMRQVNF